ncbi:DUF4328 domain-containing protein [Roseovarius sp. SCSIO 43702]|uniref:DUF4328 domain-containing protein n=1 Tax=Roseovarius sp. SCSIO 43702 TaxID=2823043 RepID=UPI001C730CD8|nr:DUF4328 domain-containing protein [Roseovarius sp. SCSIO 43702]QYX56543.1 DUF4328 domain-containing protein [Roseovarius sp. SCSIO 43702]
MSKAMEIAAERFARGEITRAEFEDIREALGAAVARGGESAVEAGATGAPLPTGTQAAAPLTAAAPAGPRPAAQDVTGIARTLAIFLHASAGVSIIAAVLIAVQGTPEARYAMTLALETSPGLLAVTLLPSIVATVLYLVWKKKSTDTLVALRGPQSVTPAGAVYWYFVPVAFFWKPYEAMRNLVTGFGITQDRHWLLPLWWGVFWGNVAFGLLIGMIFAEGVSSSSQARAYVVFSMMMYLAGAVSFFVTWMLVDAVTTAERRSLRDAGHVTGRSA